MPAFAGMRMKMRSRGAGGTIFTAGRGLEYSVPAQGVTEVLRPASGATSRRRFDAMHSSLHPDAAVPQFPSGKILLTIRCYRCGYNLKGIDPAGVCPECAAPIWPSLRPYLDPSDERMVLLAHPGRTGAALVIVSTGMLLSALVLWWPYLHALGRQMKNSGALLLVDATVWHYIVVAVLAAAGFGATFALRHPAGAAPPREYRRGLSCARTGLIGWALLHGILFWHDTLVPPVVRDWYDFIQIDATRSLLRLGLDVSVLTMIVGFRPVEKFLVRRSVPHRIGGASRQGFLPIFVAVIAISCGDLMRLAAWALDATGLPAFVVDNAALVGTMLILIFSGMMTLALLNLVIDSWRLARNLTRPLYRIEEVVG